LIVTIPEGNPTTVVGLQNNHSASIFVGDSTIATTGATQGLTVVAGGYVSLWLNSNDTLYGIAASATATGAVKVVYSSVVG
jgi:hypothetical protein